MSQRQMLIIVDENDVPTGKYEDKGECHFGDGIHHRAFVVLLENSKGEVLLQLRKHVRWDKFWDLTAISHVLHLPDHDESYQEAALRSLKDEMGIFFQSSFPRKRESMDPRVKHEDDKGENAAVVLKKIGGFNYFAKYHAHCENEYCAVLVGKYDGDVSANPDMIYEYKWMEKKAFIDDVTNNPDKYTPWTVETVKILNPKS